MLHITMLHADLAIEPVWSFLQPETQSKDKSMLYCGFEIAEHIFIVDKDKYKIAAKYAIT